MSSVPKLVYVAGPFSAPERSGVDANIARAVALGLEVARLGACPWIPHANTAHPLFEHVQHYSFWIAATAEQLRRCDAVIFTDDWKNSSGARNENEVAIEEEIPRFFNIKDLAGWLHSEALTGLGINWANLNSN